MNISGVWHDVDSHESLRIYFCLYRFSLESNYKPVNQTDNSIHVTSIKNEFGPLSAFFVFIFLGETEEVIDFPRFSGGVRTKLSLELINSEHRHSPLCNQSLVRREILVLSAIFLSPFCASRFDRKSTSRSLQQFSEPSRLSLHPVTTFWSNFPLKFNDLSLFSLWFRNFFRD